MASENQLAELRESLPDSAKLVSNLTGDGWDLAMVWVPEDIDFPGFVTVQDKYTADGTSPAMQNTDDDVSGWNKYEIVA